MPVHHILAILKRDIARYQNHSDPALPDCVVIAVSKGARHLRRSRNQLTVIAVVALPWVRRSEAKLWSLRSAAGDAEYEGERYAAARPVGVRKRRARTARALNH
jgi:hypothetical protein